MKHVYFVIVVLYIDVILFAYVSTLFRDQATEVANQIVRQEVQKECDAKIEKFLEIRKMFEEK